MWKLQLLKSRTGEQPPETSHLVVLSLTATSAGEPAPLSQFTQPASGLRLVERSDSYEEGSFAVWRGRLPLTGKLVIEFDRLPGGDPTQDIEGISFFQPDAPSREKLPHAIGIFHPLNPTIVYLEAAPKEVLPLLVGPAQTARILKGTASRYEVPVRVVVKQYRTDVECDHRSYGLAFEAISLLPGEVVARGEPNDIGC